MAFNKNCRKIHVTKLTINYGLYLGMELLGHMVILCLTFWEAAKLFSIVAAPFYISTSSVGEF